MKILPGDDGLVGAFHPHPGLRRPLHHGFDLVVWGGALALSHDAQIDLILQNPLYCDGAPLGLAMNPIPGFEVDSPGTLILHGGQHPKGIQVIGDGLAALPGEAVGKYFPHCLGGLGVNNQFVLILRVLGVAVDGKGANKVPVPSLHIQVAADFNRGVPAIAVVHQIFEGQHQAAGAVQVDIYAKGHARKPVRYTLVHQLRNLPRQNLLQQHAAGVGFIILPRKTFRPVACDGAGIEIHDLFPPGITI